MAINSPLILLHVEKTSSLNPPSEGMCLRPWPSWWPSTGLAGVSTHPVLYPTRWQCPNLGTRVLWDTMLKASQNSKQMSSTTLTLSTGPVTKGDQVGPQQIRKRMGELSSVT